MRSLVPNEKKSASSAISSARRAARGVSIMVPMSTLIFFLALAAVAASAMASSVQPRAKPSSSRVTVSGIMISTIGLPPFLVRSAAASIRARTCMA